MSDAEILAAWGDALMHAFLFARGERARQIRGDFSVRTFDAQGLHPYSSAWGRVEGLEQALPGLSGLREVGPPLTAFSLRRAAVAEANRDAMELATVGGLEFV